MKISEEVKSWSEVFKEIQVEVDDEVLFNRGLVNKAFLKFCMMWNKTDGSRKFVKHLIESLLPNYPNNKVNTFTEEEIKNGVNQCAILNIKLAGYADIFKADNDIRKGLDEEKLGPVKMKEELNKRFRKYPIEIRTCTFCYRSNSKDFPKYLSKDAAYALNLFTDMCIEIGEPEVIASKKKALGIVEEKPKKVRKEPRIKRSSYGMSDMLDEETLSKLKDIK